MFVTFLSKEIPYHILHANLTDNEIYSSEKRTEAMNDTCTRIQPPIISHDFVRTNVFFVNEVNVWNESLNNFDENKIKIYDEYNTNSRIYDLLPMNAKSVDGNFLLEQKDYFKEESKSDDTKNYYSDECNENVEVRKK